uniref:EF-hand domain-containing protein n=1 Tax=Arcella intermedia TaxID=1963864 RepID=A0A6B2LN05_9EUKA
MDGYIDIHEFRDMVYELGYFLNENELNVALVRIDTSGDGLISYPEFLKWWKLEQRFAKLSLSEEESAKLTQSTNYYRYFDKDKSGVLDRDEFTALHADLKRNNLIQRTLEQAIEDLDINHDGRISFNEYVDWLLRMGAIQVTPFTD